MTLTSPHRGYPLERLTGNTGSMAYSAGVFDRVARELSDSRTVTQRATELDGVGASITAARADAQTLLEALGPDIAEVELLAEVLRQYADAWQATAKPANDLIDDIEDAHAAWSRADEAAERAGLTALWSSRGDDAQRAAEANADARDAVDARDAAAATLEDLWLQYEGHYAAWDAAYDTALAQLAGGTGAVLSSDAQDLLAALLAADSPAEVLRLWREHPELQTELAAGHPDIIGNLDGIPYVTRAEVNLVRLEELRAMDPGGTLGEELDALWLQLSSGSPPPSLIAFDPDGADQMTAALAYGNLSSATDINVLVPGMNSNVGGIGEWGDSARALNSAGPLMATVVWFGYDSPDVLEEPAMDRAVAGASALRSFLLGVDAIRPMAETAVIAHSYGSTTAALALGSEPDALGVDQFIAVGSAGFPSDADVLANLQNAEGLRMYATLSENDLWARIGRDTSWGGAHGTVPETLPGMTEFGSDGGYADDGGHLAPTPGHGAHGGANGMWWEGDAQSGYLMEGSESFYNIQQIVLTGEPGTSIEGEGSEAGLWDFPDWMPMDPDRPYRL